VLEEFMGVPIHPLLVHAPVVLVPLLAIMAIAYAVAPFARPHTRWVLGLLALATPFAALLAKLSGDAFFGRLQNRNEITPDFFPKLEAHRHFGTMTVYATAVLGLLTLALVYFVAPRGAASRGLSVLLAVLTVVAAGVSLYYVIRTGDSGAKAVWTGR
jgi:hypothetical protein